MDFLYISAEQSRDLVTSEEALEVVERVFRWHAEEGKVVVPSPSVLSYVLPEPESRYRLKVCALPAIPVAGVRVTGWALGEGRQGTGVGTGAPANTRFVVLTDPGTGHPLAIVDEHWTYNLRTSVAGMLAVRLLARTDSRVVALVGAGQIASTCAEMLARMFRLDQIRVTSLRPASRQAFAARLSDQLAVPFVVCDSVQEAAHGADIVVTASSANAVILADAAWLADGSTCCAIGVGEADPSVYRAVDKVVVSDYELVQEIPDVRSLLDSGRLSTADIWADITQILTGTKPGRESASERIFVRASGLVTQDVALCHLVYVRALERGVGTRLPVG
jgi:ornithine cyclodeaminase/alanine dehydrogenase-like protein (mu-crystallin family)